MCGIVDKLTIFVKVGKMDYTYANNCLYTHQMEQSILGQRQLQNIAMEERESELRDLLVRICEANEDAFAAFYDRVSANVYGLALKICTNPSLAEEVTSDAFLQVWQQAERYSSSRGKVITWVLTITRSRALDALRRNAKHASCDESDFDTIVDESSDADMPLKMLESLEHKSAIYNALEKLDTEQQQLLSLAFFRGLSHSEISATTGLPLGTTKTKIRTAMRQIKDYLNDVGIRQELPQ